MNIEKQPSSHTPRTTDDGRRTTDDPGKPVHFTFNGEPIAAYEGETIAAALLATGHRILRFTSRCGEPRGMFCNMGVCFDCFVEIDGRPNLRACQSSVAEGIDVKSQHGVGEWEQA